jgi:hypothetical protein
MASLSRDALSEAYRPPVGGVFVWQYLVGEPVGVLSGMYLFYGISLSQGRISLFLVDTTRKH